MAFKTIKVPSNGEKITMGSDGKLNVPARPIIPFIEGDGTGPDIWRATQHVVDGTLQKLGGKRKISWLEVFAGDKAQARSKEYLPQETLDALAGMDLRLGMISNATSHQLVQDLVRQQGIGGYFDPLVTSAGFGRPKPHPSIFTHVLEAWGIPASQAVMVGDTLGADVLGAAGVGMRSILVDIEPNPDNSRFSETVRASARVTDLRDVPDLIRRWRGG